MWKMRKNVNNYNDFEIKFEKYHQPVTSHLARAFVYIRLYDGIHKMDTQ